MGFPYIFELQYPVVFMNCPSQLYGGFSGEKIISGACNHFQLRNKGFSWTG